MERNGEHFRQASGTPFTEEEMMESFPFTAHSETADIILKGEEIQGPTPEATEIMKECRRKIPKDEKDPSKEEIRTGMKWWDERTSTSPSGLD